MIWRYLDNPNKYKLISLRKNKILIGYLVFRVIYDDDARRILIADYFTLPNEENALFIGINHIVDLSFKIGASEVGLWCVENSPFFKIFKKKGFITRGNIPVICYMKEILVNLF